MASYNKNTDYQELINQAASSGDYVKAAEYETQRNAKIDEMDATNTNPNGYQKTNYYSKAGNMQNLQNTDFGTAYSTAIASMFNTQKPTYNNNYDAQIQAAYNAIVNKKPFSYDINEDELYKQYKDQYIANGKLAMEDTMGQAAALTGGYGSTYGQAVGQQQYNAYLDRLNDVVPQLYNDAYNRWKDDNNDLLTQYSMLLDMSDRDYDRYQDEYANWANGLNTALGAYASGTLDNLGASGNGNGSGGGSGTGDDGGNLGGGAGPGANLKTYAEAVAYQTGNGVDQGTASSIRTRGEWTRMKANEKRGTAVPFEISNYATYQDYINDVAMKNIYEIHPELFS